MNEKPTHSISIRYDDAVTKNAQVVRRIKKCIAAALSAEGMYVPCEVNVLLTNDEGIRAINRSGRGIDRATDVLSFPMFDLRPGALPLELPLERPQSRMVFHQYVIGCECREELRKFLADRGIGTAVHYPKSLAEQQAFAAASRTELPETERLLPRILSLPMYPELTEEEADFVIEAIREFFGA